MSAPTMSPEGFVWPPVNGSVAPFDNSPTQRITTPGIHTEAFVPDTSDVTDLAQKARLLAAEINGGGVNLVAEQNYDGVGMHDLGIANGRSGDHDNFERLAGPEPGRIGANPIRVSGTAERRAPVGDEAVGRSEFLCSLAGTRRRAGAVAAEQTVEMLATPAEPVSPRRRSTLAASFAHRVRPLVGVVPDVAPEATPVDPRLAADQAMVEWRRKWRESAIDTTAAATDEPTVVFAAPQAVQEVAPQPARMETPTIRSHRRGMRSAQFLLNLIHAIPAFGTKGRHAR